MKYVLLFLLLSMPVMAQIEHSLPSTAEAGADLAVAIQVSGAKVGEKVLIGEKLPPNTTLRSWNIAGATQSKEQIGFYNEGRILVWSFTAATSRPSISYVITLPNATQAHFIAVYALPPTDIGQDKHTIKLVTPTANVVVQSPTDLTTQHRSLNWLIILITLMGLTFATYHYWPQLKTRIPRLQKIDVQKVEGEFSSWLHERIDHHKERVAQKPTIIAQPIPLSQQPQFTMPQMTSQAIQENDALEQINTNATISQEREAPSPVHVDNYHVPQSQFEIPSQDTSKGDNSQYAKDREQPAQSQASLNSNNTQYVQPARQFLDQMQSTNIAEQIPIISFSTEQKPLRPEDYNQNYSQYTNQEKII